MVDNLRLFVGIGLAEGVIGRLAGTLDRMRADLPFRKWTHPADLHITLHFLGNTREDQLGGVRAAMAEAAAGMSSLRLELTGPGTFGPPHAPRILWLGVDERDGTEAGSLQRSSVEPSSPSAANNDAVGGLQRLHSALAPGLAAAGFVLDERPFRPHVTLARQSEADCGEEAIRAAWRDAAAAATEAGERESLAWTADRLTLFRSHIGRRPSYERLEEWRFAHA